MAIAALDSARGHPVEPVFRRVGPVARDLRPKNGSRLAFVACTGLGRNPHRSCGDHACADRRSLGRSRLCAHAHPLLVAELLSSIIQPLQIKRGTMAIRKPRTGGMRSMTAIRRATCQANGIRQFYLEA